MRTFVKFENDLLLFILLNEFVSKELYQNVIISAFFVGCAFVHAALPQKTVSLRLCRKTKSEKMHLDTTPKYFCCSFILQQPQICFFMRHRQQLRRSRNKTNSTTKTLCYNSDLLLLYCSYDRKPVEISPKFHGNLPEILCVWPERLFNIVLKSFPWF